MVTVTTSLIVGSGPAAAGVALALSRYRDEEIIVIDIGVRLSDQKRSIIDRLSLLSNCEWPAEELEAIRSKAVRSARNSLPEKRSYGSDYPFRDVGQLQGVHGLKGANRAVISGAYGGFSTVWGSQIMPFSAATFKEWPVGLDQMEPHYRAILSHIPFAAEEDDLAQNFPLLGEPTPLPPVHPRTTMVLDSYTRHRKRMQSLGITVGHARLAFDSVRCVSCGLCLTGCPHRLIYSASSTFDKLINQRRVRYLDGLMAYRLGESDGKARVEAWEAETNSTRVFEADRVYVACGAFGTTRLVLASLEHYDKPLTLSESVQFVLPSLSVKRTPDPRAIKSFTLNQFNMVISLDDVARDVSQVHFYSSDLSHLDAMPAPLRMRIAHPAAIELLRHTTLGLGYLPSWASPRIRVVARPPQGSELLPALEIGPEGSASGRIPMLQEVLRRMTRAAPYLDLLPLKVMTFVSSTAKSYHFGGSFPHARLDQASSLNTDRIGRLKAWRNIHLVDGSVFPNIPATTFTLSVMANAHRIAEESVTLRDE
jgi:choline dehydrogenase-like flavoprotein